MNNVGCCVSIVCLICDATLWSGLSPSFAFHFNGARWINIFPPAPLIISELSALCQWEKWFLCVSVQERASAVFPLCHQRALICRWGDVELVEMSLFCTNISTYFHLFVFHLQRKQSETNMRHVSISPAIRRVSEDSEDGQWTLLWNREC